MKTLCAVVCVLALFTTVSLFAQSSGSYVKPGPSSSPAPQPQTFGTAATNYTWLTAEDFKPWDSTSSASYVYPEHYLYRTDNNGSGFFSAHLNLDDGVVITEVRFYYKDASTGDATFVLTRAALDQDAGTNPVYTTPLVGGTTGTPGFTTLPLAANITYLNTEAGQDVRWLLIAILPFDATTATNFEFGGARVAWHRQVSPAPATATYTDVPTSHPFFQYIEALSAAGITTGCAPGQYCPDAPITRGQMAVFLSRALGLHWAP